MQYIKKVFVAIHKTSGSVMSLMFLIWFLSGIVLIFKGFPHASKKDRFMHLSVFNEKIIKNLKAPDSDFKGKVELELSLGEPIYRVYSGKKTQQVYNAQTLEPINIFSQQHAVNLASSFLGFNIKNVKYIKSLDQWVPWAYYKKILPFYKCYFNDPLHTVVYVSEKTGAIVQQTNRITRWAARLGAIPHWVYFSRLKQNTELWKIIVIILSSIGVFVSISGIIVGVIRFKQNEKGLKLYKKKVYKWHYIPGFIFGLFVFSFILSGLFSVLSIPDWMVFSNKNKIEKIIWNQKLDIAKHNNITPYQIYQSLNKKDGIRKIVWKTIFDEAFYYVYYDNYQIPDVYRLKNNMIRIVKGYSFMDIEQKAKKLFPEKSLKLSVQEKYDNYYYASAMYYLPTPAYKLELNDEAGTWLYINPATAEEVKRYTKNTRLSRWVYKAAHTFKFGFFKKAEWLRKTILILLSIVGIVISITGVMLTNKRIVRLLKRKNMFNIKKTYET